MKAIANATMRALRAARPALSALACGALLAGAAYQPTAKAVTVQVTSGKKNSGAGAAFSEEYLIQYAAPEGKRISKHSLHLTGDRRCGAWATCRVITATPTLVVYGFSLQGHNEGGILYLFNANEGRRESTAWLTVEVD